MTRQDVRPLLTLSGAVLEAQRDRVGHITLSDRCRRPVGREEKKNPPCLIFGTRTIRTPSGVTSPVCLYPHGMTNENSLYAGTWLEGSRRCART